MSFTSKYILVKKIPLNIQEITVENTLRSLLPRRAINVDPTIIIKIIRNEDSQTAFIIYHDKNLHAEIARYLNKKNIFGAYIEVKNIFFRYKENVQLNAHVDLIFDGETTQIQGNRVFSDAEGEYWDVNVRQQTNEIRNNVCSTINNNHVMQHSVGNVNEPIANRIMQGQTETDNVNQLSSRLNNLQLTVNSSSSSINTNTMPRSYSQQNNLNEANRIMSVPTSSNLTLNNNVAQIYANAMRMAGTSRQMENMIYFKCSRCKVDFGKSQLSYEAHVQTNVKLKRHHHLA
jgi:hypothetical protein